MRKILFSRDVHVETSFLLNMTGRGDCHVALLLTMTMIGLFSFNAYGECTPTPDCADMGYTETSCEGSFVRCPFDTSKLFCAPCDSSYIYDCVGDYIVGGVGSSCNHKYVSCECLSGGVFNNGVCPPPNCTVGMIYYSDKSCSSDLDSSKIVVGIVVKDNELIMCDGVTKYGRKSGAVNGLSYYSSIIDAKKDMNGMQNTLALVESMGVTSDTLKYAPIYCYEYAPTGMENTKHQWYLPSLGEFFSYVYSNYTKLSANLVKLDWHYFNANSNHDFWVSTLYSASYGYAVSSGVDTSGVFKEASVSQQQQVTCFLNISD